MRSSHRVSAASSRTRSSTTRSGEISLRTRRISGHTVMRVCRGAGPGTWTHRTTPTAWPTGSRLSPTSRTAGSCSWGRADRSFAFSAGAASTIRLGIREPERRHAACRRRPPRDRDRRLGRPARPDRAARLVVRARRVPFRRATPAERPHPCLRFTTPGSVVEMTRTGRIVWSFGDSSGENRSIGRRSQSGSPTGWSPSTTTGATVSSSSTPGPAVSCGSTATPTSLPLRRVPRQARRDGLPARESLCCMPPSSVRRCASSVGTRPQASGVDGHAHRIASVPDFPTGCGRASGRARSRPRGVGRRGLVVADPHRHARALVRIGSLPSPTHDAAAVQPERGAVTLLGGGESVSSPAVVRVDPATGRLRRMRRSTSRSRTSAPSLLVVRRFSSVATREPGSRARSFVSAPTTGRKWSRASLRASVRGGGRAWK